ncbi:MAG: hypothetical protein P1U82_20575 [Verrucomicrobiales bacterium]|nr:hypothetical protein [Verrucomicrobiales bacterium]
MIWRTPIPHLGKRMPDMRLVLGNPGAGINWGILHQASIRQPAQRSTKIASQTEACILPPPLVLMASTNVSYCLIVLLSSLLLNGSHGQDAKSLRKQFLALQERHLAQDEEVTRSMEKLYAARLRSLKLNAVRDRQYEAAQFYQTELKNTASAPLTLTFYAEEAETTGELRTSMRTGERVLDGWTSKAKATWNKLTLPRGGYEVKLVYSGNGTNAVSASMHEAKYHVTGALLPTNKERSTASLGNLRLAQDTNSLSLTLGNGVATSGIRIHQVILVSHAP